MYSKYFKSGTTGSIVGNMSEKLRQEEPDNAPASPTSPNEWSTSDNAPLLMEDAGSGEDEKTEDTPKVEPAKSSGITEFKIAASHFLVKTVIRCFPSMLTSAERIFSYSTRNDRLLLVAAVIASLCTGVTLPLMNVVFGKLKSPT